MPQIAKTIPEKTSRLNAKVAVGYCPPLSVIHRKSQFRDGSPQGGLDVRSSALITRSGVARWFSRRVRRVAILLLRWWRGM